MLLPALFFATSGLYAGIVVFKKSQPKKPLIATFSVRPEYKHTQVNYYLQDVSSINEGRLAPVEQWIDKDFAISTMSLGLVVAGTFVFPPLQFLGVGGLIYLVSPLWRKAYHDLVHRRRITRVVVESFVLPGVLLTGYFMAEALTYWFLYFALNLMAKTKGRTTHNLENVFDIPSFRSVWIQHDDVEVEIPLKEVKIGDIIVVQAGEIVPVDGIVIAGSASIDQHMLTGESQLNEKGIGDSVFATTMVLSGRVYVQVEQSGDQTISAQISQVLNEMAQFTDSIELRGVDMADRWALPYLMLGGLATSLVGPMGGLAILYFPVDDALYSAGPLGVLNYINVALKSGILIKDGRALELLRKVDTIVFDKTGTLTHEQPSIAEIHLCG